MDNVNAKVLTELGFKLACTHEVVRGKPRQVLVGAPRKFDINRGVIAVYDADGNPWVWPMSELYKRIARPARQIWWLCERLGLDEKRDRGAYVPHSNDDGAGIRELFPELFVASDEGGCCGLGDMCDGTCRSRLALQSRERKQNQGGDR